MMYRTTILAVILFTINAGGEVLVDFDLSGVDGTVTHDPDSYEVTATDTLNSNTPLAAGINVFNPSVLKLGTGGGSPANDLNLHNWGESINTGIKDALDGDRFVSFKLQAKP